MRTVYIAHPLGAGPDREANRENAARWVAWLAQEFHIAPVADWIVLSGEWPETDAFRARGLEIDLALVALCDEVWMVGGRVSPGMKLESDKARAMGKVLRDLTSFGFRAPSVFDTTVVRVAEQIAEIVEMQ